MGDDLNTEDLTPEELSYSLLVTCSNHDLLMLKYLWENFAPLFWDLSIFKCLMMQLISQMWTEAINMIFSNEATQQMIKCLSSYKRSNFIQEFIGNPFSKDFNMELRQCLVTNLCKEPYAGSLLVLLIEHFDQLRSTARKTKSEGEEIIVALGSSD